MAGPLGFNKNQQVRIIFTTLFILTFLNSVSQETLSYDNIRNELESSANSLNIDLIIPDSDFNIGITKDYIVENIYLNPCIDIKTDSIKNELIIKILDKHKLLDNLFIEIEDKYVNLSSQELISKNQPALILLLHFKNKNRIGFIVIPILERVDSIELVRDLSLIFKDNKCFAEMIKIITKPNKPS